ncbi:MAG: gliding motility-associated C-terminal domain-containing protein [Saprospiraceae bacterium]|nr:gliding motility-associated C-terminal domain-containing protein [Saprospiraceae bacterium]
MPLSFLKGQVQLNATINSGLVTTTCVDNNLTPPDPAYRVQFNNENWVSFGPLLICPLYNTTPYNLHNSNYTCSSEYPDSITICFKIFDDDGFFCSVSESCLQEICANFATPTPGTSVTYNLDFPDNLSSDGTLNFTLSATGSFVAPNNDLICDATSLGTIESLDTLSNTLTLNNYCATSLNDPDPSIEGSGWNNVNGVWYSFTTSNQNFGHIRISANSDPNSNNATVDLQLAVYQSTINDCNGGLDMIASYDNPSSNDASLMLKCLNPNTTYYVMVNGNNGDEGEFGLRIETFGDIEGANLKCGALDYAPLSTPTSGDLGFDLTNVCANAIGDPYNSSFVSQKSVWVTFVAPDSRHVGITCTSDTNVDSIDLQIAVYRSISNTCNGVFKEVKSSYILSNGFNESLEMTCLTPNKRYWILIDGSETDVSGIFNIKVTDLGPIPPPYQTQVDTVICEGSQVVVGDSTFTSVGEHQIMLQALDGCDSLITVNLSYFEDIVIDTTIVQFATGIGISDGIVNISVNNNDPNFQYLWSNGNTSSLGTGLVGGDQYCVTVTSVNNCNKVFCFTMPDIIFINAEIFSQDVKCYNENTGFIQVNITSGQIPLSIFIYDFEGNLVTQLDGVSTNQLQTFNNFYSGAYSVLVKNDYTETSYDLLIQNPLPLILDTTLYTMPSCFALCDGSLGVQSTGGTLPYLYQNTNPDPLLQYENILNNLCAGTYTFKVTDNNACSDSLNITLVEPLEFIATIELTDSISCKNSSDGSLVVHTNGDPIAYLWSNNNSTETIQNLPSDLYAVTVTNSDGCIDTTSYFLTQPNELPQLDLYLLQPIICNDSNEGSIGSSIQFASGNVMYQWSNGSTTNAIDQLIAGEYALTIVDANGCSAADTFLLSEPELINVNFETTPITCRQNEERSVLTVVNEEGGEVPFVYAIDNNSYSAQNIFQNIAVGNHILNVKDALGCIQSFNFEVTSPDTVWINLPNDTLVIAGIPFTLSPRTSQNIHEINWTSNADFSCDPNCIEISSSLLQGSTFYLVAQDTSTACSVTDSIHVLVYSPRNVFIPNTFSPNNDGINDYFFVQGGPDVIEVKSMQIYDRNGSMLFSNKDVSPNEQSYGWDGTYVGRKIPNGVFVYLIEIKYSDLVIIKYKGDVTIMR